MLLHAEQMFTIPPSFIYFCYSHWQDSYQKLRDKWGDDIFFSDQVPTEGELAKLTGERGGHVIFVCDDKAFEIQMQGKFFQDLVTRMAHHYGMTNILLVQDAGLNGKGKTTILRNCHVNCFMTSPKERSHVRGLALQLNDYKHLMSAYAMATSKPFGCLVVDNHPRADSRLKYRSNVLPNGTPCIIYRPE